MKKLIITIVLLLFILLGCFGGDDYEKDINDLKLKIKYLENENSDLQKSINEIKKTQIDSEELKDLQERIDNIELENKTLKEKIEILGSGSTDSETMKKLLERIDNLEIAKLILEEKISRILTENEDIVGFSEIKYDTIILKKIQLGFVQEIDGKNKVVFSSPELVSSETTNYEEIKAGIYNIVAREDVSKEFNLEVIYKHGVVFKEGQKYTFSLKSDIDIVKIEIESDK